MRMNQLGCRQQWLPPTVHWDKLQQHKNCSGPPGGAQGNGTPKISRMHWNKPDPQKLNLQESLAINIVVASLSHT